MKLLASIAFTLGIIMVALGLNPSWSQYARTLEEPLLLATLFCIATAFLVRYFKADNRNDVILWKCETKHFDLLTYIFFGLVLITPVTHPNEIIQGAHFVFTGLAILTPYIALVAQQKDRLLKISTLLSVVFGAAGFLFGFLTPIYTTGEGELIAAFPLAIHIWFTKIKASK